MEWVIPVIVLVVWILKHVIRPGEDQPKEAQPRAAGHGEDAPQRPASEVDRFLEEINRMRRKAAENQGRPMPEERPAPTPMREPEPVEELPGQRTEREIPVVQPARPRPRSVAMGDAAVRVLLYLWVCLAAGLVHGATRGTSPARILRHGLRSFVSLAGGIALLGVAILLLLSVTQG